MAKIVRTMDHNDIERTQENQIYQACGRALHWAQLFEAEIVTAVLSHGVVRKKFRVRSEAEAFMTKAEKGPLRNLLQQMLKRVKFEPDLTATFLEAIKQRNFLAHNYFWDRIEEFHTEEGRCRMLAELHELTHLFLSAHKFASMMTMLYAKQLGVDDQVIEQKMHRLKDQLELKAVQGPPGEKP